MGNNTIVIISGPPGTGKTTLAEKIAARFGLPLINKDGIKELLFDSLGVGNREWSKKLGVLSYQLLYFFLESHMKAGNSLVVESNFHPENDSAQLLSLIEKYGFTPLQIQCKTEGQVLLERFKTRAESGQRHSGHVDHLNYTEFKDILLKGYHEPLEVGGKVLYLDTTDFDAVEYESLYKNIRDVL